MIILLLFRRSFLNLGGWPYQRCLDGVYLEGTVRSFVKISFFFCFVERFGHCLLINIFNYLVDIGFWFPFVISFSNWRHWHLSWLIDIRCCIDHLIELKWFQPSAFVDRIHMVAKAINLLIIVKFLSLRRVLNLKHLIQIKVLRHWFWVRKGELTNIWGRFRDALRNSDFQFRRFLI